MSKLVISTGGYPVEVASPGGSTDVPAATTSSLGVVIVGDNINVDADGKIEVPYGTPSRLGVLKIGSRLTGGSDGTVNVPVANRATAGVVKVGTTMSFGQDGLIDVYGATVERAGAVKQAVPIADVQTIEVTDIASAQQAIAAMGTTLTEFMQAMRDSGAMAKVEG